MEQRSQGGWKGVLGAIFRGVDTARRITLNLIFLVLLVALMSFAFGDDGPQVPDEGALVIRPAGSLVEQLSGDPMQRVMDKITGNATPETLVLDVVDGIRAAKDDDRIKALVLDMDGMGGSGLTKLQVLRRELMDFKASGKPIIAMSDGYSRDGYYLASVADEVYVHKMGGVLLDGYGRYRTYYKEGIDRLEVDWNIFKVGTYKSAVEPYLRDGMSEEAMEANKEWMGDLWNAFVADVAEARGMTVEQVNGYTEDLVAHLGNARGDTARLALDAGLVDKLANRDEVRDRLIDLVGEDEESHSFHRVGLSSYLEALGDDRPSRNRPEGDDGKVALVVARGTILNGNQPPGTIGGDSTARLIRQARQDDDVKAIVLRVDSGGGSAFASEIIRRELVLAREEGKKVVVSMGTVAASGGYWISTASDEIWASPNTITGSIGIFGMLPTYQKPMAKHLGVRVDGIGTNWLAGSLRADREIDPRLAEAFQLAINHGYEEFLARVSEARGLSRDEVDAIAQGRVWSGIDAHGHGLVDQLGTLDDAIASAKALAGLEDAGVVVMEEELEWGESLMLNMVSRAAVWLAPYTSQPAPSLADELFATIEEHTQMLSQFDDPNGVYAHCMCEVD